MLGGTRDRKPFDHPHVTLCLVLVECLYTSPIKKRLAGVWQWNTAKDDIQIMCALWSVAQPGGKGAEGAA